MNKYKRCHLLLKEFHHFFRNPMMLHFKKSIEYRKMILLIFYLNNFYFPIAFESPFIILLRSILDFNRSRAFWLMTLYTLAIDRSSNSSSRSSRCFIIFFWASIMCLESSQIIWYHINMNHIANQYRLVNCILEFSWANSLYSPYSTQLFLGFQSPSL